MNHSLDQSAYNNKNLKWLLIIGVILVGANLRVPLTSAGALVSFIRDDFGISNALAGAITTLPLIAFALLSPFAPKLAGKFGMERTIGISLVLLFAGILIRSAGGIELLFFGTLLIGLAIAIGNVLMPGIVKMNFPLQIGLMTGLYAIVMNVFGALGSGLSIPIASSGNFGWTGSLLVWGVLTLVTIVIWLPQLKKSRPAENSSVQATSGSLMRSSLAWKITLFMGAQSLIFYTLITWLPTILTANGYDIHLAGWGVFIFQFASIPFTFIIPVIADKMKNQVLIALAASGMIIVGILGLLAGLTQLTLLWIVLLGMGNGSAFSLSMMFFTLRTKDGYQAAELSGMAQSFGYLLAAFGPVLVGGLQDITGSWTLPLLLVTLAAAVMLITGIAAGKNRQVN
ncbi:putative transporter YycB [Jeotgalicoccus aerolatus]|uniref:CP family cyanate transporter-like MFS transporter n=1 Tax=Jeotgalicoccus aerolatus TaxID=709510 RepID=A0ABS4HPX6_9STAP|nr:MFS transporter [Jeotgalicoccus aerolatus]MBP1952953.1 CP family cyanate transporter-like MFS transporter [Jeotgalicoccus aerolatus]NMA81246.1 MFS transporter [Jeotgalicoccus aerolatus]CAD2073173.1 putative transporter YycB [Jeotgalicoccus aerolatus]GGE01355.1 MFS transporter [Jeotgalicoccus aerolatus]HJG32803.1 MFS transporter [Jeotgalicoccus aerolatus]